jgi:hypothetical protein
MYDFYTGQLANEYGQTSGALNNLIAGQQASDTASQANLAAALERSRAADRAQATTVGGPVQDGEATDVMANVYGTQQAGRQNLASTFGALTAQAQGRIGVGQLGRLRAVESERERMQGNVNELRRQRLDVFRQRPMLREQARKAIMDEEIAKASERAKENIARGELGVSRGQLGVQRGQLALGQAELGERAREFGLTLKMDKKQLRLDRDKLNADIAAATTQSESDIAQARKDAWESGVEYMTNIKPKQMKNINPGELYDHLTQIVQLPPNLARKLLKAFGVSKGKKGGGGPGHTHR